jgi:hypothetical protein
MIDEEHRERLRPEPAEHVGSLQFRGDPLSGIAPRLRAELDADQAEGFVSVLPRALALLGDPRLQVLGTQDPSNRRPRAERPHQQHEIADQKRFPDDDGDSGFRRHRFASHQGAVGRTQVFHGETLGQCS